MTYKKLTIIGIDIYVLLFLVGYLGVFNYLSKIIDGYLISTGQIQWINGNLVVYLLIALISIGIFSPFLKDGIRQYKTIDLNEIVSVYLMVAIVSCFITYIIGYKTSNNKTAIINQSKEVYFWIRSLILAPIIEELFSRCGLINILEKQLKVGQIAAISISAVVFSLFHFIKQSNLEIGYILQYSLIYFVLGIGCGYVYKKTNNVLSPIILHMGWNFVTIIGAIGVNLFLKIIQWL